MTDTKQATPLTDTERMKILRRCEWVIDPAHEWIRIPLSIARRIDAADKANGGDGISSFSYINGTHAYLEGDCDAQLFFDQWNITAGESERLAAAAIVLDKLSPVRGHARWEA